MALTGPDGALWVVDMYRFMVEHPEYLPEVGKKELSPHYRLGEDRGRIYRVVQKGRAARQIPRMDRRNTIELCRAAMDSPSGWERDTAQMLLLWNKLRMGAEAKGELSGVVYGSQNSLARLQALCTLEGLGSVTPEVLVAALGDEHWAVRRQAVRIAEKFEKSPEVVAAAVKLAEDPDARVRLQLALSLGEWDQPAAGAALAKVATGQGNGGRYVGAAVLSSAARHFKPLADALVGSKGPLPASVSGGLVRMAVARGDELEVGRLLSAVMQPLDGPFSAGQLNIYFDCRDLMQSKGMRFPKSGEVGGVVERYLVRDDTPIDEMVAAARYLGQRPDPSEFQLRMLTKMLSPRSAPRCRTRPSRHSAGWAATFRRGCCWRTGRSIRRTCAAGSSTCSCATRRP